MMFIQRRTNVHVTLGCWIDVEAPLCKRHVLAGKLKLLLPGSTSEYSPWNGKH